MSMSYSGKYFWFSPGEQGFDSLHRRQLALTRRSPTRKSFWFNSRRIHPYGCAPGVRHFPSTEKPNRGFHTRARAKFCRCRTAASTPVSLTGNTGSIPVTDTRSFLRSRCWRMVAAHIRRWDGSIPSTATSSRGASGEAMTGGVNRASSPFVGANERWVRFPPPRPSSHDRV